MVRFLIFALLLCFLPVQAQEELARIGKKVITANDLADFASDRATNMVRGQVQGFTGAPLEALVRTELLVMEGKKLGIAPSDDPKLNKDVFFAIKVLNELAPKCDKPSAATIKNYYQDNIELFSTPLFVRLSRISLGVNTDRDRETTLQALEEI